MDLFEWANSRIKNMDCADMSLTKISVFAFALMIAKLWMPILNLEWYWYLAIFIITAARPFYRIFR